LKNPKRKKKEGVKRRGKGKRKRRGRKVKHTNVEHKQCCNVLQV
jgi:hypothetical protein